ncbi:uncharacterized protein N7477_002010 [Penicillium maclennaniae]|uniref:uncharacterized protein n=1 Tax=Penicillium maclennaniae TaxID=1343394 RepID=UPI00254031EC|nr:uncharacterized protein N7477_002010 [Penicillium maclennaniae]KAJ5682070.1 hypothetical protein N7477_002010 [Penicillium maclennaniae]
MAPSIRTTCFDARLLRGLVGTTVTTYDLVSDGASPESTSPAPSTEISRAISSPVTPSALSASPTTVVSASSGISRTWIITEEVSERAAPRTDNDVKMGRGSAKTIPITGTEDADHDTLARQAVPPGVCGELECFKQPRSGRCTAAPRFIGHAVSTQGDHGLLPGGYIGYLVWEKVPGEPLTEEFFWGLDGATRKDIRSEFRAAYEEMIGCGVAPGQARLSKIIFDQSTGSLHISGFRRGWPSISKLGWSEARYIEYGLAEPSKESDWILHPENWQW